MQISEQLLADELDRLIQSAILRIEQQGLHVAESTASPAQVGMAQHELDGMVEGLHMLKLKRAQFSQS